MIRIITINKIKLHFTVENRVELTDRLNLDFLLCCHISSIISVTISSMCFWENITEYKHVTS